MDNTRTPVLFYIQLRGSEKEISQFVNEAYTDYLNTHKHMITDGRSQTHVQTACLVLATYKVFKSYIQNDEELMKIIQDHMGGFTAPLFRGLLHASLFIRGKILRMNVFASMVQMMKSLQLDMGSSFKSTLEADGNDATLQIRGCVYHEIFLEEGVPQLSSCCCCSSDAVWFDGLDAHKVGYLRTSWLANGDSKCTLHLRRIKD